MNLSIENYAKAKLMLEYIKNNPDSYVPDIANATGIANATARAIVFKLVKADVVTFEERIVGKGQRYFYTATGRDLPARTPGFERDDASESSSQLDMVDIDTYRSLPGIIRALTPVILPEARRSVRVSGPTVQQNKQQSAIIRKDRAKAMSGVMYTGVSVL